MKRSTEGDRRILARYGLTADVAERKQHERYNGQATVWQADRSNGRSLVDKSALMPLRCVAAMVMAALLTEVRAGWVEIRIATTHMHTHTHTPFVSAAPQRTHTACNGS